MKIASFFANAAKSDPGEILAIFSMPQTLFRGLSSGPRCHYCIPFFGTDVGRACEFACNQKRGKSERDERALFEFQMRSVGWSASGPKEKVEMQKEMLTAYDIIIRLQVGRCKIEIVSLRCTFERDGNNIKMYGSTRKKC